MSHQSSSNNLSRILAQIVLLETRRSELLASWNSRTPIKAELTDISAELVLMWDMRRIEIARLANPSDENLVQSELAYEEVKRIARNNRGKAISQARIDNRKKRGNQ